MIPKIDIDVEEVGFVLCGKHPLLMAKVQVSGLVCMSVYFNLAHKISAKKIRLEYFEMFCLFVCLI